MIILQGTTELTVLCSKRSNIDFKFYAVVREKYLPTKYRYGILCLDKKEEGNPKKLKEIKYHNLSYIRKCFRSIN